MLNKINNNGQGLSLNVKSIMMAVICCGLWGSAVPFIKAMYKSFQIACNDVGSQFFLAGFRFLLAGIFILTFCSLKQKKISMAYRYEWKYILHVSIYQTVFQYMFYYVGLANTSGVIASIIVGSTAFFSFFLSCFLYRQEKFTWTKFLGCTIGFIGILLCIGNGSQLGVNIKIMGAGSSLLSAIFYALSSCLLKKYAGKIESVKLCGFQFFIGGMWLLIISLIIGTNLIYNSCMGIFCVCYLGIVSAVAYSMWAVLLGRYTVSQITIFTFLTPIFGSVFSCIYDINEIKNISYLTIISLVLVVGGIIIINKQVTKEG